METFEKIYKRDTAGNVRVWYMEQDGNKYRTVAGLQDGQHVTSEWTVCFAKNIGKSNQTSPEEQALSEIKSHYKKKLEGEYHKNINDIDSPRWFKPMLAAKWEDRKDKLKITKDNPVFVQPKLDGIRCLATSQGLFSRTGKEIVACPHIFEALKPVFDEHPTLVLDGELYNHDLKNDFNEIVSMVRKTKPSADDIEKSAKMVQYHIYDAPSVGGNFQFRLTSIGLLVFFGKINNSGPLVLVPTLPAFSETEVDDAYGNYMQDGYEGGIIRTDTPYEQKRSKNLLKRKDFQDDEFEILDILEGKGNWSGCAKKVLVQLHNGKECEASMTGTMEYCKEVLENKDKYVGKQATIKFLDYTPDGVLRHGNVMIIHDGERW